jgi:hypothetical protein
VFDKQVLDHHPGKGHSGWRPRTSIPKRPGLYVQNGKEAAAKILNKM